MTYILSASNGNAKNKPTSLCNETCPLGSHQLRPFARPLVAPTSTENGLTGVRDE